MAFDSSFLQSLYMVIILPYPLPSQAIIPYSTRFVSAIIAASRSKLDSPHLTTPQHLPTAYSTYLNRWVLATRPDENI